MMIIYAPSYTQNSQIKGNILTCISNILFLPKFVYFILSQSIYRSYILVPVDNVKNIVQQYREKYSVNDVPMSRRIVRLLFSLICCANVVIY